MFHVPRFIDGPLVVYGLSFIGCGINFLVKYILVCAECCLLTVAFHC